MESEHHGIITNVSKLLSEMNFSLVLVVEGGLTAVQRAMLSYL